MKTGENSAVQLTPVLWTHTYTDFFFINAEMESGFGYYLAHTNDPRLRKPHWYVNYRIFSLYISLTKF